MTCRVCGSPDTAPLWADADGFAWVRCARCGSDTSAARYDPARYGADYVAGLCDDEGPGRWCPLANHRHNGDMIDRHAPGKPGRTFLDVGTGHGASQEVMRARGWACVGWDVSADGRPAGTVVSPEFRADLFARPFDAVLAREVLEHVPDPPALLRELRAAMRPGGVLELTTPRPIDRPERQCYQWAHLALWHPDALRAALDRAGLLVVESDVWELGQRHVCRRARG